MTAPARCGLVFIGLLCLLGAPLAVSHSPVVDSDLSDWCIDAAARMEDSGASLSCGNCSVATDVSCLVNADCASPRGSGGNCVNLGSRTELAWWDDRTDGAVNDLASFVITQDNEFLYLAAELWIDPDPASFPFAEVAIDFGPGGLGTWHDPAGLLGAPGRCSVSTDRGCVNDNDCHFCQTSPESTGLCDISGDVCAVFPLDTCPGGETCVARVRTCGALGCDAGDTCLVNETCVDLGVPGAAARVGDCSGPGGLADHLIVFDFADWFVGFDAENNVLVMEPGTSVDPTSLWDPILGCAFQPNEPNLQDPSDRCDFVPSVNPGTSGGAGGPPGSVEVAIPWSAFGCTGCPEACSCPGFGPGQDFRFTVLVARAIINATHFLPDGAIEEVFSETAAATTSTTTSSCGGGGLANTECEIADGSADAYVLRSTVLPHEVAPGGRIGCLRLTKNAAPSITLSWAASCSSADNDYGVYEGTIGSWYSHVPAPGPVCSTGGATTATFNASGGDRYYLVVPTDGATEGPYGKRSTGADRPALGGACKASQSIGNCP